MKNNIIFDYDGVIIDSLKVFRDLFLEACRNERNCPITTSSDFIALFQGNMFEKMMEKGMTKEAILRVVYQVRDGLYAHHRSLKPFPGIKKALASLATNNRLFIITSNDTNVVKDFLQIKELEYFEDIFGSDKGASKVEKIQRIAQTISNRNIVYVGDTVGDIIEGKQAGVLTIGVTWGWHKEKQLQKAAPTAIVHTPEELVQVLSSEMPASILKTTPY